MKMYGRIDFMPSTPPLAAPLIAVLEISSSNLTLEMRPMDALTEKGLCHHQIWRFIDKILQPGGLTLADRDAGVENLDHMLNLALENNVRATHMYVIATEAMRQLYGAVGGRPTIAILQSRVETKFPGLKIKTLKRRTESRFTAEGVLHAAPHRTGLIYEIGSGSCQVSLVERNPAGGRSTIVGADSLPLTGARALHILSDDSAELASHLVRRAFRRSRLLTKLGGSRLPIHFCGGNAARFGKLTQCSAMEMAIGFEHERYLDLLSLADAIATAKINPSTRYPFEEHEALKMPGIAVAMAALMHYVAPQCVTIVKPGLRDGFFSCIHRHLAVMAGRPEEVIGPPFRPAHSMPTHRASTPTQHYRIIPAASPA
jgi:exopolyphosphatase/pppGpp-phosphohydrolase